MKAEERLPIMRLRFDAAHEECEDIGVRSEYDDMTALAREAVGLLRRMPKYEWRMMPHMLEWDAERRRFLDGEGADTAK